MKTRESSHVKPKCYNDHYFHPGDEVTWPSAPRRGQRARGLSEQPWLAPSLTEAHPPVRLFGDTLFDEGMIYEGRGGSALVLFLFGMLTRARLHRKAAGSQPACLRKGTLSSCCPEHCGTIWKLEAQLRIWGHPGLTKTRPVGTRRISQSAYNTA